MAGWYGSDLVVDRLVALGVDHLALNPGASLRGLHDSMVNPPGRTPQMILAMHEEIAVAIAHGYASVTGRPMAAAVHDTVGLLHASMALFNAWVDRIPMLVLVGTGPLDAANRRPWTDWIHTVGEQGALVRDFTVWNEQMTALTGYTIEEINRLGWYQSLYPDPEVRERAQIRMDRMRLGDDLRAEEWEITRKDGERRIIAISTSRLEIDDSTPGVVALIQDITDRKRDEAELRATTDLLHAVTEGTSDAIFVKDLEGRYLLLNGATCRIVGKDRSEVLGRDDTAILDRKSTRLNSSHT